MRLGLKGTFTMTVRRADGTVKHEVQFDNLITNGGMNRMAGVSGTGAMASLELWNRLVLSTNATTPAVTDTVMGGTTVVTSNSSATYSNTVVNSGNPNYIFTWQNGFQFPAGTATGTWASIGLEHTTGPVLFCKTLIKASGTPTTLTILASESLDIRYDLTISPILTDTTGTVTINGTVHNWTARPWAAGDAFGGTRRGWSIGDATYGYRGSLMGGGTIALGAITGGSTSSGNSPPQTGYTTLFQSGGNSDPSSTAFAAYITDSHQRSFTMTWSAAYTAGAVTSVNGCTVRPGGLCLPYQFIFSPAISKTAADQLSLTFTVSWVRL